MPCLESARGLAESWRGEVEIIVADGGSHDQTSDRAREAGATVVSSVPGRGRQIHAGISRASGEVVLMLHADTRLAGEAGGQLKAALQDPRVACGAFRQRIDAAGMRFRWLEAGNAFRARRLGMPYGDQAIFARRALFDTIGGMPQIPLMEDVELLRRLRRHGWPVLLPGPLTVSARRWDKNGVFWQTAKNWALVLAYRVGVSPERLARWYRAHQT